VWVDERRRDHERARGSGLDGADDAVRDRDAQVLVDSLGRCEDTPLEGERVTASVQRDEHQPTSTSSRASTGATVSTS
jgi:hypothetical protein